MMWAWADFIYFRGQCPLHIPAGLGGGVGVVGDASQALGWGRKRCHPSGLQRSLLAKGGDA